MKNSTANLSYVDDGLRRIKQRIDYQGPYLFALMNFSNSVKAISEYANSKPSKHYNEEEIDKFNFQQIEQLLFGVSQESKALTDQKNSIIDETVLATKGIVADVISPVLNFTLGTEIGLSPEIRESIYGRATDKARKTISELSNNDLVVESVAVARIALGNILLNKMGFVAIGTEPLPDPEWLKNTKAYKYYSKIIDDAAHYLGPDTIKALQTEKENYAYYTKIYSSKAKKIISLVLASQALKSADSNVSISSALVVPVALAAAKVTYSAYFDYKTNEISRAIIDEKAHLEKYIEAKNKAYEILSKNPKLERILNLKKEESITTDPDSQLAEIYRKNPALKKTFQADQQVFANEKEKIIFIQVLKDLVKVNDTLKGEYKIWQEGELDLSEKKLKIAKIHFIRIYKEKFKKYQDPEQAKLISSFGKAVEKKMVDTLCALYSAIESGKEKDITGLTLALVSVFTGKFGKAFSSEAKQKKLLTEISKLRMDVPEYQGEEQRLVGTYKHDLANMAFNKQVEAITLERISKKELSGSDQEIKSLYEQTKSQVEKELKKDPLFSESILNPTIYTKLYDMSAGLLNGLNPWGTKPKSPEKKKVTEATNKITSRNITKTDEVSKTSTPTKEDERFEQLLPKAVLVAIKDSGLSMDIPGLRTSPTTIATSLSKSSSPAGSPRKYSPKGGSL